MAHGMSLAQRSRGINGVGVRQGDSPIAGWFEPSLREVPCLNQHDVAVLIGVLVEMPSMRMTIPFRAGISGDPPDFVQVDEGGEDSHGVLLMTGNRKPAEGTGWERGGPLMSYIPVRPVKHAVPESLAATWRICR